MYAYHSIRRTSITPEGHACITITCPIHILKSETCGRGGGGGGGGVGGGCRHGDRKVHTT